MSFHVDIVIPCAGRTNDVLRLLRTLHSHVNALRDGTVLSVTLSDDRPNEATRRGIEADFPHVRYVHGPQRGPGANRNHCARLGQAEWILFLDDDCYVDRDILSAYMAEQVVHPTAQIFEGAILSVGDRPSSNHQAPLNPCGGRLWSCNFLIRRTLFQQMGGFDERFRYAMEDVDFHRRAMAGGHEIVFVEAAAVLHPWRAVSNTEVSRQIGSHAVYAELHREFRGEWSVLHLLRALRGRLRQYLTFSVPPPPISQIIPALYNFVAPVLIFVLVHVGPMRRRWFRRYVPNLRINGQKPHV